ncbi:hypothetical protein EJ110_NYTH36130 [Nymphaea thermarum]|nr:hypothetical protein EJ110_NYTH36130 [Nymphaea thermarum]
MTESASSGISTDCVAVEVSKLKIFWFKPLLLDLTRIITCTGSMPLLWESWVVDGLPISMEERLNPLGTNPAWDTWFLEDNQIKTWIVNFVSSNIQPLILRKKTARDMWVILEQMYGQKRKGIRVYPTLHWTKEWKNRIFVFLRGLIDDFEGIRSQILNLGDMFSIEDGYSRIEAEEQRRLIMTEKEVSSSLGNEWYAPVSRGLVGSLCSSRKCVHCKKTGHTVEFCWDIHPEKKNNWKQNSNGKKPNNFDFFETAGEKTKISLDQIRELQAYLSCTETHRDESSDDVKVNHARTISCEKGNSCVGEWIVDSGATHHMAWNPKVFHEYKPSSGKDSVSLTDGSSIRKDKNAISCSHCKTCWQFITVTLNAASKSIY